MKADVKPTPSHDFAAIPDEALAHHVAILGKTGSGKTNAAKVTVERLLDEGTRVCVLDPTGAWFGLRSSADGDAEGYPVTVFGGQHGDLPLTERHGAILAEIVGTSATPAVLDMRGMTVAGRTRLATDFAETLLRKNQGPLHLVIDEAHVFIPQGKVNDPQSGKMLHAFNGLVAMGRSAGLRIIMISQRPAKLHKDSLTQIETLVAMRLIAPHDVRAVKDWIGEWADPQEGKDLLASLPSLPTGTGWIWSPEIGVLARAAFPLTKTYDSGKAPAVGDGGAPVLATIDIEAVKAKLEAAGQAVANDDPKTLRARVAQLERELTQARKVGVDAAAVGEAEARGFKRGREEGWMEGRMAGGQEAANAQMRRVVEALAGAAMLVGDGDALSAVKLQKIKAEFKTDDEIGAQPHAYDRFAPPVEKRENLKVSRDPTTLRRPIKANGSSVGSEDRPLGAERRPLAVLAGVYPAGMTEAQWAVAAGLKRTGGTWSTYVSRLRSAGRIERDGQLYHATPSGIDDLGGSVEAMPSPGPELVEFWASRIPGADKVLRYLAGRFPYWVTREELGDALSLAVSGGTLSTYLSRLRSPGLIEEDGAKRLRASPALMEAA